MDIDPLTFIIIILFIANMAQAMFLLIKHMSIQQNTIALDRIIYNNRIEYRQYSIFAFPSLYRMILYFLSKSMKKEIGLYMMGQRIISVRSAYHYRKSLYQTIQYHTKSWYLANCQVSFRIRSKSCRHGSRRLHGNLPCSYGIPHVPTPSMTGSYFPIGKIGRAHV